MFMCQKTILLARTGFNYFLRLFNVLKLWLPVPHLPSRAETFGNLFILSESLDGVVYCPGGLIYVKAISQNRL